MDKVIKGQIQPDTCEVMLVSMPWALPNQPSLQLGILQARLRRAGIPTASFYANLEFARKINRQTYADYASFHNLLAEWIFAESLNEDSGTNAREFFEYARRSGVGYAQLMEIRRIRELVTPFLNWCLEVVDWSHVRIVGFTTTMLQPISSLALARLLKQTYPHLRIIFGGAGCMGIMGEALHRNYGFIDGVVDGEADETIVPLVSAILKNEEPTGISGLIWRKSDKNTVRLPPKVTQSLHDYPIPDFTDFFDQLKSAGLAGQTQVHLPFEASRGCWWAVLSQCDFCGLNGLALDQRTRSINDVIAELQTHKSLHGIANFAAADNIISPYHLVHLPNALRKELPGTRLFFEVRAVMQRAHMKGMADGGIVDVQPGLESLITKVLKMVHKGTTAIQNLCFLRRTAELGIKPHWNFLYGLPNEERGWYESLFENLPQFFHLTPPEVIEFSLQRFSPYFDHPERYGIEVLGSLEGYKYIWRLPEEEIRDLCFDLNFKAPGTESRKEIGEMLRRAVAEWGSANSILTAELKHDSSLQIRDTRPCSPSITYRVMFERACVLRCLESPVGVDTISRKLLKYKPKIYLQLGGREGVKNILYELENAALIYAEDNNYLTLAIPTAPGFWLGEEGGLSEKQPQALVGISRSH